MVGFGLVLAALQRGTTKWWREGEITDPRSPSPLRRHSSRRCRPPRPPTPAAGGAAGSEVPGTSSSSAGPLYALAPHLSVVETMREEDGAPEKKTGTAPTTGVAASGKREGMQRLRGRCRVSFAEGIVMLY